MNRTIRRATIALAAALTVTAWSAAAHAQVAGFVRLFRPYHQVVLAQLDEVAKDLKLTDEQKDKAVEINDQLNQDRGALWQEAAGDFESIRDDMAKLNADAAAKFAESLDDAQKTRLAQIYAQTNGPTALFDDAIAKELKLTKEQQDKLSQTRQDNFGSFQDVDWQSLSEEEANKEIDDMIATQDTDYSAVLTDEQKTAFEKMQGEKLEIDLANLPNPFGG